MKRTEWFLTVGERGNPATTVDRHHPGRAWSEGNLVVALAHGRQYFERLYDVLQLTVADDLVLFTDWRGDPAERLVGVGTEVVEVLSGLAMRGVLVRGLIWRSHPNQIHFSEQENVAFAEVVNAAGGQVFLDERVRRVGSHHQKLVVVRYRGHPDDDVAFVGGSICATDATTMPAIRAILRLSRSMIGTARDLRGTTCRWRSGDR